METTREKFNLRKIRAGEQVYIGRGWPSWGGRIIPCSKWHNPYPVEKYGLEQSLKLYEDYLTAGRGSHLLHDLHELAGKVICCHCETDQPCHGDILIKLIHLQENNRNHGTI